MRILLAVAHLVRRTREARQPHHAIRHGAVTTHPAICLCGHPQDTHTHYRHGSDCGACACRNWVRWTR